MPTDGSTHGPSRPASRSVLHLVPKVASGGQTDGAREWPLALRSERPRLPIKDQLASLQADAQEMDAYVASLSRLRGKPKRKVSVKWAQRARTEREAKRGAECENQQLRQQVLKRRRYLQRFGKLLRWTAAKTAAVDIDIVQPLISALSIESVEDVEVFETLKHREVAQIEQVDDIFRDAGLMTRSMACERDEVVADGNGNAFIRFVACEIIPFSIETSCARSRS